MYVVVGANGGSEVGVAHHTRTDSGRTAHKHHDAAGTVLVESFEQADRDGERSTSASLWALVVFVGPAGNT